MATQTKIPPTVSNPWWGHDPSDKQLEALWAYEECPDLFYGGAAGPGKTSYLLMAAVQYVQHPHYRALILRKTYADLSLPDAIMDRAISWWDGVEGARFSHADKTCYFPSGARVQFGYMASVRDHLRYQGAAVHFVGIDEASQIPSRQLEYLHSRIRRAKGDPIPLRYRLASNPGDVSHDWLKDTCLPSLGSNPGILAVDAVPENKASAGAGRLCQLLPRFTYRETSIGEQESLLPKELLPRDNINDEALDTYRARYGEWVTNDHIFAYVYGILHSPEYRERYAGDLAKLLPRIPEVATAEAFRAFSEAGQRLLNLHIGYEAAAPYPLEERLAPRAPAGPERYRVQKMRWAGTSKATDRSIIVYNDWITLAGIPDEAHEYVVGPRSALEWLLDRYRVTTDKDSGIVNDPNDWGLEIGDPRYIIDLVKRVTTVSVETMAIVKALPPLEEGA